MPYQKELTCRLTSWFTAQFNQILKTILNLNFIRNLSKIFLLFIITCLLSTLMMGCGGSQSKTNRPDRAMVERAVQATLEAVPTPEPLVLEVTRVVEVIQVTATDANATSGKVVQATE